VDCNRGGKSLDSFEALHLTRMISSEKTWKEVLVDRIPRQQYSEDDVP
jgi:hypothetical protein